MDSDALVRLQQALVLDWQLELVDGNEDDREEALLGTLRDRIVHFLQSDMNGLLAAMYRLDIGERAFEAAMRQGSVEKIAEAMAVAVLEREKVRVENRRRSSGGAEGLELRD